MLTITGKLIKKYKPIITNIGFYGSDIHRFVVELDRECIGHDVIPIFYHPVVFKEIMFQYEHYEMES